MDAEYLNLYILGNSIGLVVCGFLGAGCAWLTKKVWDDEDPVVVWPAALALVFSVASITCGYHVAKANIAPMTVRAERNAK